jgi:hypothetical protein
VGTPWALGFSSGMLGKRPSKRWVADRRAFGPSFYGITMISTFELQPKDFKDLTAAIALILLIYLYCQGMF